jgi:hypothetical protein
LQQAQDLLEGKALVMAINHSALEGRLFADELNTYAVLDGASVPGLLAKLAQWRPEHVCLFRGELAPGVPDAAPYLVTLRPGAAFADWVLDQGWGRHWGIFAQTAADFRTMRKHCRTFLVVHGANGKPLYFRFYDPRVLRLYLPTCTPQELAIVFGPVGSYLMEAEDPTNLLHFRRANDAVQRDSLPLNGAVLFRATK